MSFLFLVFVALFAIWFYIRTRKPKNFPPGPPRLPVVGSFPFMQGSRDNPSLILGLSEQMKKHGPIIGFYFGSSPAVFLADQKSIKDAFKSEVLSARPDLYPSEEVRPGYQFMNPAVNGRVPGVLFSHGPYWRELRRFLLRNLRDFGFGKTSMEDLFVDEVAKLCQYLSKSCGHPISLFGTMNISIVNALWSILTGEKLELEDPNLRAVVDKLNKLIKDTTPMSPLAAVLPLKVMAKWPIINKFTGHKLAVETFASIANMIKPYIDDHLKTLDQENIRDFLDLMIKEHQNSSDPNSCFNGELGKATIVNTMIDMFAAGMETTTTSLLMVILHLLHHPEVQEKVQEEIDTVVGNSRFPSFEDRVEMPYTNAVLLESLRVGSLAYFAIPHSTLEEFKIGDYTLPKDTIVMSSLYHAMHDPNVFEDPDVFKPQRFIDADGKFVHDDRVIAFGVGKRYCLGQSLAEKEFFIFFTGLLQQFKISQASGTSLPSYINIFPSAVLIRSPPPYQVVLTKRNK